MNFFTRKNGSKINLAHISAIDFNDDEGRTMCVICMQSGVRRVVDEQEGRLIARAIDQIQRLNND